MKKYIFLTLFLIIPFFLLSQGVQQINQNTYQNPILPGFHPDPSIVRVGDDFYMVTSSFEFWPAIPIYHSKDLVNWKLINHVVNRKEQINMSGIQPSDGFYAPTIRYNNGTFYLAVSYVIRKSLLVTNYIFKTTDIRGDWSQPYTITQGDGWKIDPDLFFDDNGKTYFSANALHTDYPDIRWRREIRMQEIDIENMKLTGKVHTICRGAMIDAVAVEAPHVFKKDGKYFLVIAEGGTGIGHSVTIFKSDSIFGPYKNYGNNPILTHRHLAYTTYIQNVGHADLVERQNGEWWLVALGVRNITGIGFPLGRETFLVPMIWEKDKFPVINPTLGGVPDIAKRPNLNLQPFEKENDTIFFKTNTLPLYFNTIRNTRTPYKIDKAKLELALVPETLSDTITPAFIGRRLQHHSFEVVTKVYFKPESSHEEAGLSMMYDSKRFYNMMITSHNNSPVVVLKMGESETPLAVLQLDKNKISKGLFLKISSKQHIYNFSFSYDGTTYQDLAVDISGKHLHATVFTGTYTGFYASSNGKPSKNTATFEFFTYRPLE